MATPTLPFRLTHLRIKNFRSIGEANLVLEPLTVLVGPNGSGKSNVVDALRFLRDCFTRGLDQAVLDRGGMTVLRRWAANGRPMDIALGVTVSNGVDLATYDVVLAAHSQQGFSIKREEVRIEAESLETVAATWQGDMLTLLRKGKKHTRKPDIPSDSVAVNRLRGPGNIGMLIDSFEPKSKEHTRFRTPAGMLYDRYGYTLLQILRGALFYTLNPAQLRAPQRLVQEAPFDETGDNLAAVLRQARRSKRSAEDIRTTLKRLVKGLTDFSVKTTGSYLVTSLHYLNAAGQERRSDLGQESDGTLRVLGMLAALYQKFTTSALRPTLPFLTIEEPEVNIHPGMLAVLAEQFQEASLQRQILLTTHSPDLLDFLPVESFRVVEKMDGETVLGALAADQQEIVRQRLFGAGELLRTEGLHRAPTLAPPANAQAE